jgi:hypothetical protein
MGSSGEKYNIYPRWGGFEKSGSLGNCPPALVLLRGENLYTEDAEAAETHGKNFLNADLAVFICVSSALAGGARICVQKVLTTEIPGERKHGFHKVRRLRRWTFKSATNITKSTKKFVKFAQFVAKLCFGVDFENTLSAKIRLPCFARNRPIINLSQSFFRAGGPK